MHCVQASYLVGAAVGTVLRRLPQRWAFILVSCNEPHLPGGERTAVVDPNQLRLCQGCLPRGWDGGDAKGLSRETWLRGRNETLGKDLQGW